jgi:hypothetical protein
MPCEAPRSPAFDANEPDGTDPAACEAIEPDGIDKSAREAIEPDGTDPAACEAIERRKAARGRARDAIVPLNATRSRDRRASASAPRR